MLHIKKIKPMFTTVVTTGDRFTEDQKEGSLIVANKGDLKLWQTVIAVGTSVRDIKEGDKVMINVDNYAVKKYNANSIQNDLNNNPTLRYNLNWITLYDDNEQPQNCLLLTDRDILFSFEGEETDNKVLSK